MDRWLAEVAPVQHSVFSRGQATEAGFSRDAIRHQLRVGAWRRLHRDVFALVGAPDVPMTRVMAAVLAGGDGAIASHTTAAGLYGLPGFTLEPVVLTVERPRNPRLIGATVHRSLAIPGHHRHRIDRIATTTLARTLFDLCGSVHALRAERAVDNALARKQVTHAALWRVLDDLADHGRAGSALMRELLEARGGRYVAPESELEARFVDLVRAFGLPEPRRQVDLGNADHRIGRVDFVWTNARLIVEVDGRRHHSAHLDIAADTARDAALGAAGWRVERLTWRDVTVRRSETATHLRGLLEPLLGSEGGVRAPGSVPERGRAG